MKLLKKFSVLTFIALSVVFTSCSKDDDDSSPSIIGTWELVKSEYNIYSMVDSKILWKKETERKMLLSTAT